MIYVIDKRDKFGLYWVNGIIFVLRKGLKVTIFKLHEHMVDLRFSLVRAIFEGTQLWILVCPFSQRKEGLCLKEQG